MINLHNITSFNLGEYDDSMGIIRSIIYMVWTAYSILVIKNYYFEVSNSVDATTIENIVVASTNFLADIPHI